MTEKKLGKIKSVSFGMGGYQDVQFGISFSLGSDGDGCGDFWGYWAERSDHAQWSLEDQQKALGKMNLRIIALLSDAKKSEVSKLAGTPIEITYENNALKAWRVLKEVV